jgi:hypothetical protein
MESTPRKWYTKKRYIIPTVLIAGIVALVNMTDKPQQSSLTNVQENSLNVPISPTPPSNQIPNDTELQPLDVEEKPTPPPPPTPKPTPTPMPVATPTPKPNCHANYSGCVPIASDVDCAGGSGNGPAYVRGPVEVIGIDVYDLDRDGDGIGCE